MKAVRSLEFLAAIGLLTFALDCTQATTQATLRSLDRSGKVAFLCIADPASATPGRPLHYCHTTPGVTLSKTDYRLPHVIALVTQTARGEVAVVDLTAGAVLDQDPSAPSSTFIPVGQMPTSIVTTSASSAAFVSVADPTRPGIFSLPAGKVLPGSLPGVPMLTSFPACALPALPGAMTILNDPRLDPNDPRSARAHCPNGQRAELPDTSASAFSLAAERETTGTPKLVVALPELGELAIIDAQDLLSLTPGSFDLCPIELRIPLKNASQLGLAATGSSGAATGASGADAGLVDVATNDALVADAGDGASREAGASGNALGDAGTKDAAAPIARTSAPGLVCLVPPAAGYAPVAAGTRAWPSDFALSDDARLFVSDQNLPVVHELRAASPCSLAEVAPLLATSRADPGRKVEVGPIAVSPLTSRGERFVYAVDTLDNGSLMVFDVSNGAESRRPLELFDPQYQLSRQPDRLTYAAPVQSLTFADHDVPLTVAASAQFPTGVITGHICDPLPDAVGNFDPYSPQASSSSSKMFGVSSTAAASPASLRGVFGFAALGNGQVSIIDLDDYDAPCRRPIYSSDTRLGCDGQALSRPLIAASDEVSCRVVEPHKPRSAQIFADTTAGNRSPTMQTAPILRNKDNGVLPFEATQPRLLGPYLGPDPYAARYLAQLGVTGQTLSPCPYAAAGGADTFGAQCATQTAAAHWVAFDLREPRAHTEQLWDIRYQGQLPGFAGHLGTLQCTVPNKWSNRPGEPDTCEDGTTQAGYVLRDASAAFCNLGVQDDETTKAERAVRGDTGASSGSGGEGDTLQILQPITGSADPYWATTGNVCSYDRCMAVYGTPTTPLAPRERSIIAAYQDRLVLAAARGVAVDSRGELPLTCCFPYPINYTVRASGAQWVVLGASAGYLHHIVADPADPESSTARCKYVDASCDQTFALRNGRARMATTVDALGGPPAYDSSPNSKVFRNPQLQFIVWEPDDPSCDRVEDCVKRDMNFQFQEVGGFKVMNVALSTSSYIFPRDIAFLPSLHRLAIPDGIASGLLLIDLNKVSVTETYY